MSQGILITASKVATPFKSELLSALASPRFSSRPPHLVGILATKKEDARTYAEFTKKACETLGITYELRLVGEARKGMDGEGVGIEVEEAILEVCRTRFFSFFFFVAHGETRWKADLETKTKRPTKILMWTA